MKNSTLYLLIIFMLFSCSRKASNNEFAPLFPFLISHNGPVNVTNMSHLLDAPAGKDSFALNPKGKRKKEIPVILIDGKTEIMLKPEYKTIWYEIEIK
ncbi:hypothetical protein [uncultured Proteiniphilum sp.]|uniref:hypothetical protein n=1 Tax=uncultured Proteiniphilum sp. TaxID=497637 RepID=UPI002628F3CF|nr:hypothetical protein [uncultured Proteiniphilum sp.]